MEIRFTTFHRLRLLISIPVFILLMVAMQTTFGHIGLRDNGNSALYSFYLLLITAVMFVIVSGIIRLHHQQETIKISEEGFTLHRGKPQHVSWSDVVGYQLVLPPRRGAIQSPRLYLHLRSGKTLKFGHYPFFLSARKSTRAEAESYNSFVQAVQQYVKG